MPRLRGFHHCNSTNIIEHNLKNMVLVLVLDHIAIAQVHALAP